MTKRLLIIAVVVLFPLAAWALDASNERAAAGEDYLPGSLATQFARMASSGDYLPGGDSGGGGPVYGTPSGRKKLLLGVGS